MATPTVNVVRTTDGPSTVTRTTTTYETKKSSQYVADTSAPTYRSNIAPRNIIIQRSQIGGGMLGGSSGGGGMTRTIERSVQYGALSSVPPGARWLLFAR